MTSFWHKRGNIACMITFIVIMALGLMYTDTEWWIILGCFVLGVFALWLYDIAERPVR